jgi:hypothetical protein
MGDCRNGDLRAAITKSVIFGDDIQNAVLGIEDGENGETSGEFEQRLIHLLGQMMFVSGETAEPSPETTWMIEEIVREQVMEMVSQEPLSQSCFTPLTCQHSSHERLSSPTAAAPNPSQSVISSSRSATTEPKFRASRPSSPGKTCAKMSRTPTTRAAAMLTSVTLRR